MLAIMGHDVIKKPTTDEDNISELQATLESLRRVIEHCKDKQTKIEDALAGNAAARKHVLSYSNVLVIDHVPIFLTTTDNTPFGKLEPIRVG
jgi:septation ring formation regulator EzrA